MERRYELRQSNKEYGFAELKPNTTAIGMAGRNAWYLKYIWVSPDKRGRHYGHILLAKVCRAADQEAAELTLGVDPSPDCPMKAAALRSFYRRFGFKSTKKNINHMIRKPVVTDDTSTDSHRPSTSV